MASIDFRTLVPHNNEIRGAAGFFPRETPAWLLPASFATQTGDASHGCISYLPQPKEEDPDDGDDYATAVCRRLGLGRSNGGGSS
jgi:hypothetical protein